MIAHNTAWQWGCDSSIASYGNAVLEAPGNRWFSRGCDQRQIRDQAHFTHFIVHAFERKLPFEEDVYGDFYLPAGKLYIEYSGMEKDPKYASRMKEKQAIYAQYGLNLVELGDGEIRNLDDVLPRLLFKYNIDCT